MEYSVDSLLSRKSFICSCGKEHKAHLKKAVIERGASSKVGQLVKEFNCSHAYVIADCNTFSAAGKQVIDSLDENGIGYSLFTFSDDHTEPDEKAIGSVMLHFDYDCDIIIGIGSGVINDIGKIAAKISGRTYFIVGTAPSMDGYASSTSSVIRGGLKVSVDSSCPDVVIGDIDVLCASPLIMIRSGLGDMLAKYISVCEWRIGHIVTNEYYCDEVAAMVRAALKKCVDNAEGIVSRDETAVKSVMEGLIISGIAADYAGVSRPVSGVEHYFSHIWDMRSLEFGTPCSLHGIQCGIGTYLTLGMYEKLVKLVPDKQKSLKYFDEFDRDAWNVLLKKHLNKAAETMINNSACGKLYDKADHEKRVENIVSHWDEILAVIKEELPTAEFIGNLLEKIGAPLLPSQIGIPDSESSMTFKATKDIRDKYILSAFSFDMGVIDEI